MPRVAPLSSAETGPPISPTSPRPLAVEEVLFQLPRQTVAMLDAHQGTPGPAQPQPGAVATDRAEGGSRPADHLKMRKPALPGGL